MTDSSTRLKPEYCYGLNADLMAYLGKAASTRTPITVGFALTHRCSFRCRHCYLGCQESIGRHKHREMDAKTVFRLLDEMAEMGTLMLTLTGGDPMIRPDFPDIYEYAVKSGLLVSVYCNGSLITDTIIDLFRTYPPKRIEITIYGVTEETYAAVTMVQDGLKRFRRGIDRLEDAGLRYTLKTMVMTLNVHELQAMRREASERGVHFYHDTTVIPCLENVDNGGAANGCEGGRSLMNPLSYRLAPEEAGRIDVDTDETVAALKEKTKQTISDGMKDALYQCGAAQTSFYIDPYGWMQPCIVTTQTRFDLNRGNLMGGWNGPLLDFRKQVTSADNPCMGCFNRILCTGCPGHFMLETGSPERPSPFFCRQAAKRREMISR